MCPMVPVKDQSSSRSTVQALHVAQCQCRISPAQEALCRAYMLHSASAGSVQLKKHCAGLTCCTVPVQDQSSSRSTVQALHVAQCQCRISPAQEALCRPYMLHSASAGSVQLKKHCAGLTCPMVPVQDQSSSRTTVQALHVAQCQCRISPAQEALCRPYVSHGASEGSVQLKKHCAGLPCHMAPLLDKSSSRSTVQALRVPWCQCRISPAQEPLCRPYMLHGAGARSVQLKKHCTGLMCPMVPVHDQSSSRSTVQGLHVAQCQCRMSPAQEALCRAYVSHGASAGSIQLKNHCAGLTCRTVPVQDESSSRSTAQALLVTWRHCWISPAQEALCRACVSHGTSAGLVQLQKHCVGLMCPMVPVQDQSSSRSTVQALRVTWCWYRISPT